MSSQRALRTCMQLIVFLNLVFVQMTGAAGLHWLVPLFALTLGAPYLQRYRETLAYRVLWNGGVVCFFGVLVRHALQADLAYVLEDGLVMAVLCQVHLLNNLRSEQRPDLLFFNAFLIAIITGFMTRGIGFPIAFLAFVPCYVVGLQLLSATRDGHVPLPSATKKLVVDAVRRGGVVLAASLLVFLFWPRDFERKAFLRGNFEFPSGGPGEVGVGYNQEIILALREHVAVSNRRALQVTLLEGERSLVSPLWRGATLSVTDGKYWRPMVPSAGDRTTLDERWRGRRGSLSRGVWPEPEPMTWVDVVRFEQETERLFAPLGAFDLTLRPEHRDRLLRAQLDGALDIADTGDVGYKLGLRSEPAIEPGGSTPAPLPAALAAYVELPDAASFERARELSATLAARLPEDVEQHQLVTRLREYLERTFVYLPPGAEGAARSLDEFLRGEAGAHCEFFASALAVMLRSQGIPCRVVTGFRSDNWDALGRVLSFGTRDAHAWVEVHDPRAGWYAVDPSPLLVGEEAGASLWARLQGQARSFWATVTGFDSARRAALFAWVRGAPAGLVRLVVARPFAASAALLLSAAAIATFVTRRRARTDPSVRAYRTALGRLKLRPEGGETPRELLARARTLDLRSEHVLALERATREHEATRYA